MNQKVFAVMLRVVIIIVALGGIFICAVAMPDFAIETATRAPEVAWLYIPALIYTYVFALVIYIALVFAWGITRDIALDNSFSRENADRLKAISVLALVDTTLVALGFAALWIFKALPPYIFLASMMGIVVGISIAVAFATLSHLVMKANAIKSENDLTV